MITLSNSFLRTGRLEVLVASARALVQHPDHECHHPIATWHEACSMFPEFADRLRRGPGDPGDRSSDGGQDGEQPHPPRLRKTATAPRYASSDAA